MRKAFKTINRFEAYQRTRKTAFFFEKEATECMIETDT